MVSDKPVILLTGASGNVGNALINALQADYEIVGMDLNPAPAADASIECDFTSDDSMALAMREIDDVLNGRPIAAVIHLAAYFDFTGNDHPLYHELNVAGTRRLLSQLRSKAVERFIYASTMLVHQPASPGIKITEDTPVEPGWIYPQSKADAEQVIADEHGEIPVTILRMAGLYDDHTAVPTLSHQIARIYERDIKSWVYSGDAMAGQAFIHQQDMTDLFARVVSKRNSLPDYHALLAGEDKVMGYQALQNRLGQLIHGKQEWETLSVPQSIAKPGAWIEEKTEPVVPDDFDHGDKPFIRPFMIDLSSDHYDLDISRAESLLGWHPQRRIHEGLAKLVANLLEDPAKWYSDNGITAPDWITAADDKQVNAEKIRHNHIKQFRQQHDHFLWAHFLNMGLAFWLITAPFLTGYQSQSMIASDIASGVALFIFASLSLSWKLSAARWACGAIGLWVLNAPLVFWAPTAQAYLNDTFVGMLIIGLAVCSRPTPGVSIVAAQTGPDTPPGWSFNPSGWVQRMPIIILAFVGFFISRYLCAYQLGHIDAIWDPFFTGTPGNQKNGTEEIITSSVSEAWPVPDAGLGAMTYALEIITGIMGSVRRWRTMPWLVMLFGIMIVPLGAVSIFFIIIQPVVLGTWCTLCLIAAAAMLIQIPYSLDELVATSEFLYRRKKAGRPLLRIFFTGDTDDGPQEPKPHEFRRPAWAVIKDMLGGGVNLPWNLALGILVGIWLMCTRLTLGVDGTMAHADHIIGALALTVIVTAMAESARVLRYLLIPLGAASVIAPIALSAGWPSVVSGLVCGGLLIALSLPRGQINNEYGLWHKLVR
ncbi:NAD-dependent epimerase/dehydratase family protein [Alteromonas sp. ASW11-19]|uniref:NAD-dependent epimerase/dehydratase family protein n=1 Tax=Alteromonas salexigens TaxID=2982530 RepID=A0ABT2VLB5_9ALTE|nr:vitamin K epoxide reductase family protein [Alteromonas salexigens]MCU7554106.1 NAD-dependent epimerase/dehydratase family protein [Alteromonas salexigens]